MRNLSCFPESLKFSTEREERVEVVNLRDLTVPYTILRSGEVNIS